MKKIIVPIDFSQHAADALDFAIQFNEKVNGKIVLLHVLELPAASVNFEGDWTSSTAEVIYRRELIDGASNKLHEWADRVKDKGQEVAIKMEFGSPYKGIGKEIAEENADYVVMGSKGASGLMEVFVGSNTERVIRHSTCPVFTIKGKTDLSQMQNMVFATNLMDDQEGVAGKAKEMQELLGLNMHVLKVRTHYNFISSEDVKDQMEEFAERVGLVDYTLNTNEADFPDEGIVEFAEQNNAGLIVMGTHGRTGMAHLFGGSKAEDVANESTVPLLTFRIEE